MPGDYGNLEIWKIIQDNQTYTTTGTPISGSVWTPSTTIPNWTPTNIPITTGGIFPDCTIQTIQNDKTKRRASMPRPKPNIEDWLKVENWWMMTEKYFIGIYIPAYLEYRAKNPNTFLDSLNFTPNEYDYAKNADSRIWSRRIRHECSPNKFRSIEGTRIYFDEESLELKAWARCVGCEEQISTGIKYFVKMEYLNKILPNI